jgi:hypothetical protein
MDISYQTRLLVPAMADGPITDAKENGRFAVAGAVVRPRGAARRQHRANTGVRGSVATGKPAQRSLLAGRLRAAGAAPVHAATSAERTRRWVAARAVVALTALAVHAGCVEQDIIIHSLEPSAGARGTTVTVLGAGFCGGGDRGLDGSCAALPSGTVTFGLSPQVGAVIASWRDDEIVVQVPGLAATGPQTVVVTVDGRSSNGVLFEVR